MLPVFTAVFALAGTLLSGPALSEPIKLKLSYFSSDRTMLYLGGVKPFVDAVTGHAAAAPPRTPRNSRRRMFAPPSADGIVTAGKSTLVGVKPGFATAT
jgi:hypothetical protein